MYSPDLTPKLLAVCKPQNYALGKEVWLHVDVLFASIETSFAVTTVTDAQLTNQQ